MYGILFNGTVVLGLLGPAIAGLFLDWSIGPTVIQYTISAGALISVSHFVLQFVFALIHNRYTVPSTVTPKPYGVQVTGWKEDPKLFKACLQSIKVQTYQPSIVTFCSDGNSADDEYMVDIFKEVFCDAHIVRQTTCTDVPVTTSRHLCITQPHRGKRYAMNTQMQVMTTKDIDYIITIDSDTVVDRDAFRILVSTAQHYDADAVTGDVRIYNQDNLLSTLISLKYWYAFNIERAAQSLFGRVGCMAGPFSIYKRDIINTIRMDWISQTFMGKECTFGDDRHMTNLILKQNGKTLYTPHAFCYTDTPTTLKRFVAQQTRWGKSFVREYLLTYRWFHPRQLWLIYDMGFMTVYSLTLTVYIIIICVNANPLALASFIGTAMLATLVRSLYAVLRTRNAQHIVFILYVFVFVCIIIPVKLWAFFTVSRTHWGTGNRKLKSYTPNDIVPVILWNVFLFSSCVYSSFNEITTPTIIWVCADVGMVMLLLACYCVIPKDKMQLESII